jgi:hypothetical protein
MRILATAIEAYAVDHNSYCLAARYTNGEQDVAVSSSWVQYSVRRLTTPVAFMTSIPDDPFIPNSQKSIPGAIPLANEGMQQPSYIFQYHGTSAQGMFHPNFEAYFYGPERGMDDQGYYPSFKLCLQRYSPRMWILISHGINYPRAAANGITASRFVDWKDMPYDPSNGTVSRGIIVRSGP